MKQANVEAEWIALTALTCSPSTAVKSFLLSRLTSGHFGYEVTHPMFVTLAELAVKTGTVPSYQTLAATPGISPVALQSLAGYASTHQPLTSEDDAKNVFAILDLHRKGRLVMAATNATLSEMQDEAPDMAKVREHLEKACVAVSQGEDEAPLWHFGKDGNSDDLFLRVMSSEKVPGIPTGFKQFDERTGGFRPGNLVALASHYKGGKSVVAYNMALHQYRCGYNVLFVPLEMSDVEVTERHLACISNVDVNKISQGKCSTHEQKTITKAYREFKAVSEKYGNRFSLQALPTVTFPGVVTRYKSLGYHIVYVDYMNLMESTSTNSKSSDTERVNSLGREGKAAAARLGSALVTMTQLDEKTEDLRYGKALKEHCNNAWKWVYKEAERATGVFEVQQMCARSWEPFSFKLQADFAHAKVSEAPDDVQMVRDGAWNKELGMDDMFNGTWGQT